MSYQEALEAAGAEIHQFEHFGSYQGDWYALVTYKGQKGWIAGSYGSCSGCDAFEAEFGWTEGSCEEHRWDSRAQNGCSACGEEKSKYRERLADFGRSYLDDLLTQEEAEKQASKYIEWDSDAPAMLEFLKAHAV